MQISKRSETAIISIALLFIAATYATAREVDKTLSGKTDIASPIHGLKVSDLRDSFHELHNGHLYEAIDIMQPRGTPVYAVIKGTIRKLYWSRAGGNTIYEFDDTGEYCYYYAHLDRYADNLHEGSPVSQGEMIGYVGSTGNAASNAPYLHFAIYQLGPGRLWWEGNSHRPLSNSRSIDKK